MSDPELLGCRACEPLSNLSPEHERRRLERLRASGLIDDGPQAVFDRLTRLTTRLLGVPMSLISLVESDRQVFVGATGLSEPTRTRAETPRTHSFCQRTLQGTPFVVDDAREDERVSANPAIEELGVVAYLGVPLEVSGRVFGALCAIDHAPREWTTDQLDLLTEIGQSAVTELELRMKIRDLEQAHRKIERLERLLPICAGCKSIRDETGAWQLLETYFENRDGISFSHGFCPECVVSRFP